MKSILKDTFKFQKIKIDYCKVLNYLISIENVVISLLKILKGKNEIGRKTYITLHPVGFEPWILYELAKIHKTVTNKIPSFRPILSAIATLTYQLAKFCCSSLRTMN